MSSKPIKPSKPSKPSKIKQIKQINPNSRLLQPRIKVENKNVANNKAKKPQNPSNKKKAKEAVPIKNAGKKDLLGPGTGRRGSQYTPRGEQTTSVSYVITRKGIGVPATFTVTIQLTGDAEVLDKPAADKPKTQLPELTSEQETKLNKGEFGERWYWKMRYNLLLKVKSKDKPKWDSEKKGDIEKYLKYKGITKMIKISKKVNNKPVKTNLNPDIFLSPSFQDELSAEQILGESLFLGLKF